jgi:hypothetical protein
VRDYRNKTAHLTQIKIPLDRYHFLHNRYKNGENLPYLQTTQKPMLTSYEVKKGFYRNRE